MRNPQLFAEQLRLGAFARAGTAEQQDQLRATLRLSLRGFHVYPIRPSYPSARILGRVETKDPVVVYAPVQTLRSSPAMRGQRTPQPHCLLCGAALSRTSPGGYGAHEVCSGCAERLELELTMLEEAAACPDCGRHRELCLLRPCGATEASLTTRPASRGRSSLRAVPPSTADHARAESGPRRRVSGAERVREIEGLAASRLGVRELSRRTGYAPSTISRWLKIDRCPSIKQALESDAVDIGRAKLLTDAPEAALQELVRLAPHVSRRQLASRVASLRAQTPAEVSSSSRRTSDSTRLRKALRLLQSISRLEPVDRPIVERLARVVDDLKAGVTLAAPEF